MTRLDQVEQAARDAALAGFTPAALCTLTGELERLAVILPAEAVATRNALDQARAELEKLRAPFRLAPGYGRYVPDRTPTLVTLPRHACDFLATLVGGTGDFMWGEIAEHFELTPNHVRDVYDILTAAARDTRCVSCGEPLVQCGDGWYHAGESCGVLIVPEHLQ